jgi:hypothetical protein
MRCVAFEMLKARLVASVVSRRRLRSSAIWVAAAAAVAGVIALGVGRPWRANDLLAQLVGDHVLITLNEAKPLEVRDRDAGAIERWFGGKVDFALRLPRLDGANVVGGRVCNFAGRRRFSRLASWYDGVRGAPLPANPALLGEVFEHLGDEEGILLQAQFAVRLPRTAPKLRAGAGAAPAGVELALDLLAAAGADPGGKRDQRQPPSGDEVERCLLVRIGHPD